jgi:hypothetical protein
MPSRPWASATITQITSIGMPKGIGDTETAIARLPQIHHYLPFQVDSLIEAQTSFITQTQWI